MLSVPVQLIVCKDHPQNDLLCVERDIKHLFAHSLTAAQSKISLSPQIKVLS